MYYCLMMMILNHWVIVRDKRMILRQVSFRKENDNDEVEKNNNGRSPGRENACYMDGFI